MPLRNFITLGIATLLLTGFLTLTLLAKFDKTKQLDFDTTVRIQDHMPERLKPHLIRFVQLGSWQVMSVLVFATMLIQRKHFWKIGILFLLIVAVEVYGKYELQHPPPPEMFVKRFEHLNLPDNYVREESSYPSGHAARSAFLALIWIAPFFHSLFNYVKRHTSPVISEFQLNLPFGFVLSRQNAISFEIIDFTRIALFIIIFTGLISFTFLIGFIKIYLGEHWMSDVLGGWMLGSALGILATQNLSSKHPEKTIL